MTYILPGVGAAVVLTLTQRERCPGWKAGELRMELCNHKQSAGFGPKDRSNLPSLTRKAPATRYEGSHNHKQRQNAGVLRLGWQPPVPVQDSWRVVSSFAGGCTGPFAQIGLGELEPKEVKFGQFSA
jgi:hypothetical protein